MGCLNSTRLTTLMAIKTNNKSKDCSDISDIDLFSSYFSVKHKSKEQTLSPNIKCNNNINNQHYTLLTNCNSINTNNTNNNTTNTNNTSSIVLKKVSSQDTSTNKTESCLLSHMKSSLIESVSDDATKYMNENNYSFDKSSTGKLSANNLQTRKSLFQQTNNIKGLLILEIHITDSQSNLTTTSSSQVEIVSIHQHVLIKDNTDITKTQNSNHEVSFIFGKSSSSNKQGSNGASAKNDYGINDTNIEEKQFEIIYNSTLRKYYLNDIADGNGVFYKIASTIIINEDDTKDEGMVITFCNCYVKFEIKDNTIVVTFFENGCWNRSYVFVPKDKEIKFGRSKIANVIINHKEVSRIQFTLSYENDKWVLYNGYIDENKKHLLSTNGIFVQVKKRVEIEEGIVFKTGKTIMHMKLIEQMNMKN